jgi:hypothetical protein
MDEGVVYSGLKAIQVQLSRLFGSESKYATCEKRTPAQWRKTLEAVLGEIENYVAANADTDEFHRFKLFSGLHGAREALKQNDFWPGYVEGITRLALILLGDYPDHRRRKSGRKQDNHYKLDLERTLQWIQTPEQRFRTLIHAGEAGFPQLSARPIDVLHEFRSRYGSNLDHAAFLEWYRANFPEDYASIFR